MKYLVAFLFCIIANFIFAQDTLPPSSFQNDTVIYSKYFYNYFIQDYSSDPIRLCDIMFNDKLAEGWDVNDTSFKTEVLNYKSGYLYIYYRNSLMYIFSLKNGKVDGYGELYYLKARYPALTATFKDNLIDGFLVTYKRFPHEVREVAIYKKNRYIKTVYYFGIRNPKSLKRISRETKIKKGCVVW